jgi:hypothetical protein
MKSNGLCDLGFSRYDWKKKMVAARSGATKVGSEAMVVQIDLLLSFTIDLSVSPLLFINCFFSLE